MQLYRRLRIAQCAFLFLSALCFAQENQKSASSGANESSATSQVTAVAANEPVVTIKGLCEKNPPAARLREPLPPFKEAVAGQESEGCRTVVNRSDFETLVKALDPKGAPRRGQRFASDYSNTAVYAKQGRILGLEQSPEFQELMKFKYMEALAQIYKHHMSAEAEATPEAEVEKYYREQPQRFEQLGVLRIFVPRTKTHSDGKDKPNVAAEEAEMKTAAEKIRQKAARGGDFDKLQNDAYLAAGDKETVLGTDLGNQWTRDNTPPEYWKMISPLQPGQVSEAVLYDDGWYIFKVVSRRTVPLKDAKAFLVGIWINDLIKSLNGAVKTELSPRYFEEGLGSGPKDGLQQN